MVNKMTNQNPEPIVLTADFEIQAGTTSGQVRLDHEMGQPEQMSLYALYCYIYPGFLDIGPSTDYPAPATRRTYTDIDGIYLPMEDNADRVNTSLPICCNPRTWTDLSLSIYIDSNPVPSKIIELGPVNAKYDRTLPFSVPIKVKWSQQIYLELTNNNPATAASDTFSKVAIALNGEIVNYEQLRREQMAAGSR